ETQRERGNRFGAVAVARAVSKEHRERNLGCVADRREAPPDHSARLPRPPRRAGVRRRKEPVPPGEAALDALPLWPPRLLGCRRHCCCVAGAPVSKPPRLVQEL